MNCSDLLDEVLSYQSPRGAFRSQVQADEPVRDENCFITALVLFELIDVLPLLRKPELEPAVERGLDFIEHCAEAEMREAFCFYPPHLDSPRYNGVLPPDIDDTVLAWTAEIRSGRRNLEAAADMLRRIVEPYSLKSCCTGHQPWMRPGASLTWFTPPMGHNPADLCVNANVLALYALCGEKAHPNYAAVVMMLDQALDRTSITNADMVDLAPYYAHPLELVYAVQRAIRVGAEDLAPMLQREGLFAWAAHDINANWPRDRPICCYPPGYPFWIAPALQTARQLSFVARQRSICQ